MKPDTASQLTAPFPYAGGKRRWCGEVWDRFGDDLDVYVEPFCGSLAMLLGNPHEQLPRRELVCDNSAHVANFWRALKADPQSVAAHADYPTIHHDLHARNIWLAKWNHENSERVFNDAEYHDCKAAGWWAWGKAHWINNDYPSCEWDENGPGKCGDFVPKTGAVISGSGVSMQRTDLTDAGTGLCDGTRLAPWLAALARRLRNVVVLRRSWESALTPTMLTHEGTAAIFLDPPYLATDRQATLYASDRHGTSDEAATQSYEWAVEHGSDERVRIAYCCHEGDFPVPSGWDAISKGFKGVRNVERRQCRNDQIMFSPNCQSADERRRREIETANEGSLFELG